MKSNGVLVRVMALLGATAVLLLAFHLFVRPWYLQWGATGKEAREPLVGDRIVANAASQETRAITIHAGVQQVWPWLAQLGQDRGGFYSFDILENLAGCEMPTTDGLRPDRQSWQEGDKLWMYPSNKAGGAGFATLRDVVPGRALGFGTHMVGTPIQSPENGSWSFALEPIGAAATRLLIRGRGATGRSPSETAFDMFLFEPLHFMMERRMMIGVKELAEGSDRGRLWNHLLVALFAAGFGLWLAAAVQVLRRSDWRRSLAGFLAAGAVFQVLTLGQPPLLVGLALLAAVGGILWWPIGRERAPAARSSELRTPVTA